MGLMTKKKFIGGDYLKRGLGQFTALRGAGSLEKNEEAVFLRVQL